MGFSPFLDQIAARFASLTPDELARLAFVFPNRRSGYFFQEYFKNESLKAGKKIFIAPFVTTMSALVENWSRLIEARPSELLMMLFRTYIDITTEYASGGYPTEALEPDRFVYWCEMVLRDFNDVDLALAPAAHLFRNLKDLKELQTNPLSDEQFEAVKHFWDVSKVKWLDPEDKTARMWINRIPGDSNEGIRNFLRLWTVMGPLYEAFTQCLLDEGKCYPGLAHRKAVELLKGQLDSDNRLEKEKYIFIGFSYLTQSEKEIFSLLKKSNKAEFYWDDTLPHFDIAEEFPLRLVKSYLRMFPQPDDFEIQRPDYSPDITIYGVPSETGQVRKVAQLIHDDKNLDASNALQYAIVLSETSLCRPLLSNLDLPSEFPVNISLGYPLKDTPIAALVGEIARMRAQARFNNGQWEFLRDSVISVVNQPLLMKCRPQATGTLMGVTLSHKSFFIAAKKLMAPAGDLDFIFNIDESPGLKSQLDGFIDLISRLIEVCETSAGENNLEKNFLLYYQNELISIGELIERYDLEPYLVDSEDAIFTVVEKIMRRLSMTFAGTPLKGIQIMGVLETRVLDFDTVIITSVNERSFPRKLQKASFIPQSLRSAYGLDDMADEETVMAYHFYRLIARASKVYLLYNNDTDGLKSGEVSRYVYQLQYLCNCPNLKEVLLKYPGWAPRKQSITIDKTPEVMEQLDRYKYKPGKSPEKSLSASSIKKYLNCPLDFYLSTVCGFGEEDDDSIHIDDSIYGKIAHDVMDRLMQSAPKATWNGKEYPSVNSRVLDRFLESPDIERFTIEAIRRLYLNYETSENEEPELNGEAKIFKTMVMRSIREMLRAEKKYLEENGISHFLFFGGEIEDTIPLRLNNTPTINFHYIIDRADRAFTADYPDGYMRIIDYKTGSDPLTFKDIENLVDYESCGTSKAPKAMTQLMLYSIAYVQNRNTDAKADERIQPLILSFRDVMTEGTIRPLAKVRKKERIEITDYREIAGDFATLMATKINEMFNPDIPFAQASNSKACTYCKFKEICGRTE